MINENPLEAVSAADLRKALTAGRKSQKDSADFYKGLLAEQELVVRHFQHPSTVYAFQKYGFLELGM